MSTSPHQPTLARDRPDKVVEVDVSRAAPLRPVPARAPDPAPETDPLRHWIAFEGFTYHPTPDPALPAPGPGQFRNPVLRGYHPDPSVCRVGSDFYLVTSSFSLFPGIPVFHSRDLVSWTRVGHVLDRASQAAGLVGVRTSGGVYAPTIRHHDGKFHVTCTLVDGGGNFICTADHPSGPWSEPVWLRSVHGIDPSPWFEDGRCWILHNGGPDGPDLYDGHRAIRMQEVDPVSGAGLGPSVVLVDGGSDISTKPIWVEGPHLFKRDGYYYLVASEGGTAERHSVVVFRSRHLPGPYLPCEHNPILTQRDLPDDRSGRVTCTGHADLVELEDGSWWAVFLGCRPFEGDHYLTGRETFLLPVTWERGGWPVILPAGRPVPLTPNSPLAPTSAYTTPSRLSTPHPTSPRPNAPHPSAVVRPSDPPDTDRIVPDADRVLADVDASLVGTSDWVTLRPPAGRWFTRFDEAIVLAPKDARLSERGHASFLARRLTEHRFDVETTVRPGIEADACEAGLAFYQDDDHHLFVGVSVRDGWCTGVFVEVTLAGRVRVAASTGVRARTVGLAVRGSGATLRLEWRTDHGDWAPLGDAIDGRMLSTLTAGGFQGVVLGMHARAARKC